MVRPGVEVRRIGLLTQLCSLREALSPSTPQAPPTLAARMVKGLKNVDVLLKQEIWVRKGTSLETPSGPVRASS